MKNKFYLIILFAIAITVFSCKEDERLTKTVPESTNTNGFLVFKDRNTFEAATKTNGAGLENLRSSNSFTSLKKAKTMPNLRTGAEDLGIDNEFLLNILNSDGMVQIDKWIFKLNGATKTVTALNADNIEYLQQLKEDVAVPEVIFTFSFEDDVLNMLENGITSSEELNESNQRTEAFCFREGGQSAGVWRGFTYVNGIADGYHLVNSYVDYGKWGVYFELRTHFTMAPQSGFYVKKDRQATFDPKCKSERHDNTSDGNQALDSYCFDGFCGKGGNYKIYASGTALHRFKVTSTYRVYDSSGNLKAYINHPVYRGY